MNIFKGLALSAGVMACLAGSPVGAGIGTDDRAEVLGNWYRMILELVRHTPTQTPPVASRAFAYTAIIAYEATASGSEKLQSLAGQVAGLDALPARDPALVYDEDAVLNAAMARAVDVYFANTGPTGQRAKAALTASLTARVSGGVDPEIIARSEAYGLAIAEHVIAASASDGGAVVENMGFPMTFALGGEPAGLGADQPDPVAAGPAFASLGQEPPDGFAGWRGLRSGRRRLPIPRSRDRSSLSRLWRSMKPLNP